MQQSADCRIEQQLNVRQQLRNCYRSGRVEAELAELKRTQGASIERGAAGGREKGSWASSSEKKAAYPNSWLPAALSLHFVNGTHDEIQC